MNDEGNEDVCMCVCDKERREEKKNEKKRRIRKILEACTS
jgi:hypothetical protein